MYICFYKINLARTYKLLKLHRYIRRMKLNLHFIRIQMSQFTYKNSLFFLFLFCCLSANTFAQQKSKKSKSRLIQPIAEGKLPIQIPLHFTKLYL